MYLNVLNAYQEEYGTGLTLTWDVFKSSNTVPTE